MIMVDTNILLNAVNEDSPGHQCSRSALESILKDTQPWALCWGMIYEFLRVATHRKVFTTPVPFEQACGFIEEITTPQNLCILTETSEHLSTLAMCREESPRVSGNLVHDFHYAVLMREHGISDILTVDRDFRAFPWVNVIEPPAE